MSGENQIVRPARLGMVSGLLFVLLFLAGALGSGLLASQSMPLPGGDPALLQRYYAGSADAAAVAMLGQGLAALALAGFAGYLVALTASAGPRYRFAAALATIGGAAAAAFAMLSVAAQWVASRMDSPQALSALGALQDFSFLTGGPAHVAFLGVLIGAASLATMRAGILPGWLAVIGMVLAAISVLSVLTVAAYAATPLIPLGRFGTFLWIIVLGVVLLGRRRAATGLPA